MIERVGGGPDPFDVTGNERIAAAFGPDGAMYIAFNDENRDLVLGRRASDKDGFSYETIKGGDEDTGEMASIAVDKNGVVHVIHYDRGVNGLVDSSGTPGKPFKHTTILPGGSDNTLVQTEDGTLHLVAETLQDEGLRYGSLTPGGSWKIESVGEAGRYTLPALSIDEAGGIHIAAWHWSSDFETGEVVAAHKTAGSWTTETIDFVQSYATDIVFSNGTMHIVYPEPDGAGLSYATRDASGVWSAPESILDWESWHPDLEIDEDDNLVVAFTAEGGVRIARRSDDGWEHTAVVTGNRGFIQPHFVSRDDRTMVVTNKYSRSFHVATFEVAQP